MQGSTRAHSIDFFNDKIIFVDNVSDFPAPSGGIITLLPNITYFICSEIDLTGDRIVCGENTVIIGGSSENCRIKSTGLAVALITSEYSLPMRNISLEADLVLDLDGDSSTTAIDWFGVNFVDCLAIGTIKNYSNVIFQDCAFLNSGGLIFDGTIGTVGISQCFLNCNAANTLISLAATLTLTRRFRAIYSSFIVGVGETGIDADVLATIPTESYILDTINFSGGGTYLAGIDESSNDSLFVNCTGIENTSVNGQYYMQSNATATVVAVQNTWYKIAGTTTASPDNSKFSHSDNRIVCDAEISRKYEINAILSFSSGNGDVCEFGFYDSVAADVRIPSRVKSTANASGRAENVGLTDILSLDGADYIEVWCRNTSGAVNITVDQLNFTITEIR